MNNIQHSIFSLIRIGVTIQQMNKCTEKTLGLSLVQWYLLKQLIDLPASSAFNLAQAVGVHPSTLTQTLKRLEKKKYIFTTEDPSDSRRKLISITRFGKEKLESVSKILASWPIHSPEFNGKLLAIKNNLATQVTRISGITNNS